MRLAPRREYMLVLLTGAIGAGLVLLAIRQAWGQAIFVAQKPLPAEQFAVSGTELVPLAGALALAALACLAAVIATRSLARRAAGALLALLGVGTAVAASTRVGAAAVIAAAKANATNAASATQGGSTTSGASPGDASHPIVIAGSAAHAVLSGVPWRVAALIGAVAIVAAGLATIWHGARWPAMSARYELANNDSAAPVVPERTSASMWESLSRDVDPTEESRR